MAGGAGSEISPSERLRLVYEEALSPEGGFLPDRLPITTLPEPFTRYVQAATELPERYSRDAGVQGWLSESFASWDPQLEAALAALDEPSAHGLMTMNSLLCHAFRWNIVPPRPASYQLERIELPAGLLGPWTHLAARLGQPRVGTLYNMVLNNWRIPGRAGGGPYENAEIVGSKLEVAFPWLLPPIYRELKHFLMTVIEMEARGAAAMPVIIELLGAAERRDTHQATYQLERLAWLIQRVGSAFAHHIKSRNLTPTHFLRYIQPTTIWGLDEGEGRLEGASGPMSGIIQTFDAILGLPRQSRMGQAMVKMRAYMPPGHRRFIETLEGVAPTLRGFIAEADDPKLYGAYNECIKGMQFWRRMHQKRGAWFLKGKAPQYSSTGLMVAKDDDRVAVFEETMAARIAETTSSLHAFDADLRSTLDSAFRCLTEPDRVLLLGGARRIGFARDEVLLNTKDRHAGLFLIREGQIRVVIGNARSRIALARMGAGEIFGEISFLENSGASATIVADEPTVIDLIPREHVFKLIASVPGFAGRFYQSLATFLSERLRVRSALLPELLSVEKPLRRRSNPIRTGRQGQRPVPELVRFAIGGFCEDLGLFEKQLERDPSLAQSLQPRISRQCGGVVRLLCDYTDDSDEDAGIRDWIFRQTAPWFRSSALIDRISSCPRGFAGDHETMAAICAGQPAGDGVLGPLIDTWFRALPTVRALASGPEFSAGLIRTAAADWERPLLVTSLGSGAGQTVLELLSSEDGAGMHATCIELDRDAVIQGQNRAHVLGVGPQVDFVHENPLRLAQGRGRTTLMPQSFVLILTALDLVRRRDAVSMLDWAYANLRPGGAVLARVMSPVGTDQVFFEHVLDWTFERRDGDGFNELFTRSDFGADPVTFTRDVDHRCLYGFCIKR